MSLNICRIFGHMESEYVIGDNCIESFIICFFFIKYLQGRNIGEDKMGGAFITSGKLQTQSESDSLRIPHGRARCSWRDVWVARDTGYDNMGRIQLAQIETSSEVLLREYSNGVSHNKIYNFLTRLATISFQSRILLDEVHCEQNYGVIFSCRMRSQAADKEMC